MRREPLLAGLLCVVGAFLVLVGVGRTWVLVTAGGSPLLPAADVGVTGADLAPGLRALGLVGLAGVPALAATRGRGRTVVGAVLLLVGAAVVAVVLRHLVGGLPDLALDTDRVREAGGGTSADVTGWPLLTGLGGLVLAAAGALVAARGRTWSGLGRRYDAPAPAAAPAGERDLWEALDRGEDPTGPDGEGEHPRG